MLQLRSDAQITSDDAGDGRWHYRHGLERRRSNRGCVKERIANIQKAVEKAAECPARHLESVAVVEGFRDQTIWEGVVEIFTLHGHAAQAKRAYGWQTGYGTDAQFTAVLEIPPVDSPNTAVRAAIAAQANR